MKKLWNNLKTSLGFGEKDSRTLKEIEYDQKREEFIDKFNQAQRDGVFCDDALQSHNVILDKFEEECNQKIEILEDYERRCKDEV